MRTLFVNDKLLMSLLSSTEQILRKLIDNSEIDTSSNTYTPFTLFLSCMRKEHKFSRKTFCVAKKILMDNIFSKPL